MSKLIEIPGGWQMTCGMEIDADGSPRAYGPGDSGLDFLQNGGPKDAPYGYELNPHTGQPFRQGFDAPLYNESTRGMYVSCTTYQRREFAANDPHRYLNSETEFFIVVPGSFRKHVSGIVLGCKCEVEFRGKISIGIVGDVGPAWGEASIAFAKALGIDDSPRHGGVEKDVTYRAFPGVTIPGYSLQPA